jgi:membrane-associated protease RseP (regulator of RpoE activity)
MWFGLALLLVLSYVPALARVTLARAFGMRVPRVMIGFGPKLATWTINRTRWQLHAIPIAAFSQIAGLHATDAPVVFDAPDSFAGRSRVAQLVVLLGGAIGLFTFSSVVSVAANLAFGAPDPDVIHVALDSVVAGGPAAAAGLLEDDEILAIDGKPIDRVEAMTAAVRVARGPLHLTVRRKGVDRTVDVTPERSEDAPRIGVTLVGVPQLRRAPVRAILDGVRFPARWTVFALGEIGRQTPGHTTEEQAGAPGALAAASRSREKGGHAVFMMLAIFAAYLALFTAMVPVPPTDGSRVLGWLFRWRRTHPSTAPIDAGAIAQASLRASAAWVVLVTLVGMWSVAMLLVPLMKPSAAWMTPLFVATFLGLLWRRAWAWALTRTASTYATGMGLLCSILLRQSAYVTLFACFLPLACLVRARLVRERFGLRCPACHALDGEPVLGARHSLACMRCGSSWTAAAPR